MKKIFWAIFSKKIKTHFLCSATFLKKSFRLRDNVENIATFISVVVQTHLELLKVQRMQLMLIYTRSCACFDCLMLCVYSVSGSEESYME